MTEDPTPNWDNDSVNKKFLEFEQHLEEVKSKVDNLQRSLDSYLAKINSLETDFMSYLDQLNKYKTIIERERKRQNQIERVILNAIAEDEKPIFQRISEFAKRIGRRKLE